MKWYPSILEVVKADELKVLSKDFIFCFEFRIHRTIKRDANLVGPRKIERSSIKIKSKERHYSTPEHVEYFFVIVGVGCPDVSQKSRHLCFCWPAVYACLKSRCTSELLTVGSPDPYRESRHLGRCWLAGCLCTSEVPMFVGSSDIDLRVRTSDHV